MRNKANNINAETWLNNQPTETWLSINDIPNQIFYSIWQIIESNRCKLHREDAKYMICKLYDYENR